MMSLHFIDRELGKLIKLSNLNYVNFLFLETMVVIFMILKKGH